MLNFQSGICLDINSSGDVVQATCDGSASQNWQWGGIDISRGEYSFHQIINSNGECLGVSGDSTAEGARADVAACSGNADQYWESLTYFTICEQGETEYYLLENEASDYFLSVVGDSNSSGASVDLEETQSGCTTQYWWLQ
ncbi:MAG: RICIN domain-containing protein [Trebonia sp.]